MGAGRAGQPGSLWRTTPQVNNPNPMGPRMPPKQPPRQAYPSNQNIFQMLGQAGTMARQMPRPAVNRASNFGQGGKGGGRKGGW